MNDSGFECSLCMKLAMSAQICEKCGFMYCKQCLLEIFGPNYECVQCQSKQFKPIEQSALQEAYEQILNNSVNIKPVKINKPPPEPPVVEIQQWQTFLKENCINFDLCKSNINQIFQNEQVCSLECLYYTKIIPLYEYRSIKLIEIRKVQLQQDFANIRKEINNLEKYQPLKNVLSNQQVGFSQFVNGITRFTFNRCAPGIQILESQVILQEDTFTFKTATSSVGFQQGIHYWKIIPLPMSKNEMKIGVSTSDNYDLKTSFSDYNFGYAFYTIGQFRNGSNSNGLAYGARFTNTGEVGVLLDMNRGILAFSYNGNFLGKAITTDCLKKGPIYPCVALLRQAGFEFQCGIPIPQNLLDLFLK